MFPKAKNSLSALQYVQCLKQRGCPKMASLKAGNEAQSEVGGFSTYTRFSSQHHVYCTHMYSSGRR